jgi:hypothetical protein
METICPDCGGADCPIAPGYGILKGPVTIRPVRKCRDCGRVFEPPSSRIVAAFVTVFGLGIMVANWPDLIEALSPFHLGRVIKESVFCVALFFGGLQIARLGASSFYCRKGRRLASDDDPAGERGC